MAFQRDHPLELLASAPTSCNPRSRYGGSSVLGEVRRGPAEVLRQVDTDEVLGITQYIVYEGYRLGARLTVREQYQQTWVVDSLGLQVRQAGDDLLVVLDPVVKLPQPPPPSACGRRYRRGRG